MKKQSEEFFALEYFFRKSKANSLPFFLQRATKVKSWGDQPRDFGLRGPWLSRPGRRGEDPRGGGRTDSWRRDSRDSTRQGPRGRSGRRRNRAWGEGQGAPQERQGKREGERAPGRGGRSGGRGSGPGRGARGAPGRGAGEGRGVPRRRGGCGGQGFGVRQQPSCLNTDSGGGAAGPHTAAAAEGKAHQAPAASAAVAPSGLGSHLFGS